MSQVVKDSDGTLHEFPDDATPEQMAAAMGLKYANPAGYTAAEGSTKALANSVVLGQGSKISAAGYAAKSLAQGVANGLPISDAWDLAKDDYSSYKANEEAKLAKFAGQNPAESAWLNVAGSLPASMAGGMVLNQGLSKLPVVGRFLAGVAGQPNAEIASTAGKIANTGVRVLSGATNGLIQGTAGGALTSGLGEGSLQDQATSGGEIGALAGGAIPLAGSVAGRWLPTIANAAKAKLVGAADRAGINITTDQLVSGAPRTEAQARQFTQALSKTFGENSAELTPEVFQAARGRLGKKFDDIAANSGVIFDQPFLQNLAQIGRDADVALTSSGERRQVANILGEFTKMAGPAQPGVVNLAMDGEAYQKATRKGGPIDALLRSQNPNIREYGGQIRRELDDALERTATASGQPELIQDLRDTRKQWKNLTIAEKLAGRSDAEKVVDPSKLKSAVLQSYKGYASKDIGDIGDLAEIGQTFLGQAPKEHGLLGAIYHNPLARMGALGLGAEKALEHFAPTMATNPYVLGTLGAVAAGTGLSAMRNTTPYRNLLIDATLGRPMANPLVLGGATAANQ